MKGQLKGLHHFPGHMKRAILELSKKASLCDVLIELCDARAPLATRNPLFEGVGENKPRVIVLSKADLADPDITKKWIGYFNAQGLYAVALDSRKKDVLGIIKQASEKAAKAKREKEKRLGMKPQDLRLAVFGIPNVGKSTLINSLAGRKMAKAENRPGVTRAEQWIKLPGNFVLLDTPGILPMESVEESLSLDLTYIGSIRDQILPSHELAVSLLGFLKEQVPGAISKRYEIEESLEPEELLRGIAAKRGLLLKDGKPDEEKAALVLLKEFREGTLGKISLESPDA